MVWSESRNALTGIETYLILVIYRKDKIWSESRNALTGIETDPAAAPGGIASTGITV